MADTNLGQVVGIWLEPTEPPHKNVLWIKTINLLTSEKAGFIWNGIEWINIQGQGFYWKGEFDIDTDYKKNDVVRFEDILYIKLNDIVNNEDNPDENDDFDLFLPSFSPQGVEGSVQIKDVNGRFFGNSLLSFIAGLFSIHGSFFLKSNSSSTGNAVEFKNATNQNLRTIKNTGEETKVISNTNTLLSDTGVDERITYNMSVIGGGRTITGKYLLLTANMTAVQNPTYLVGQKTVLQQTGANAGTGIYHSVASWNEVLGGSGLAGYFNNAILVGDLPVYHPQPVNDLRGYFRASAHGANAGMNMDLFATNGGMRTIATFARGGTGVPTANMLAVGDGGQISLPLFIDRKLNTPNVGANDTTASNFFGARVKSTTQFQATSEIFFKTTALGSSVEPLLLTGKDVKMGYSDGKQGFFGKEPIVKPSLTADATTLQILEALKDLGLLNIIIP